MSQIPTPKTTPSSAAATQTLGCRTWMGGVVPRPFHFKRVVRHATARAGVGGVSGAASRARSARSVPRAQLPQTPTLRVPQAQASFLEAPCCQRHRFSTMAARPGLARMEGPRLCARPRSLGRGGLLAGSPLGRPPRLFVGPSSAEPHEPKYGSRRSAVRSSVVALGSGAGAAPVSKPGTSAPFPGRGLCLSAV